MQQEKAAPCKEALYAKDFLLCKLLKEKYFSNHLPPPALPPERVNPPLPE